MREKHNKRTFLASSLVPLLFLNLFLVVAVQPLKANQRDNVFWVVDIGVNIVDLAVADGKVFITTHAAELYCLNQQNGGTVWKHNFGAYSEGGFLEGPIVADGKVFVGSRGSKLSALDENTEKFLWEFQPNLSSSFASKTPPLFTVADGKVFTTGDGFYSVNATNGELIWGYEDYKSDLSLRDLEWMVADGRVFIAGIENAIWYLYSLNADNGEVLWTYKIFKWLNSPPIVADGRVFVWDRHQNQTMLCLNETSGSLLWSYDVGAQAFQPTISDGLVFFGASDGNFYALNESDGALKWKYQTGLQIDAGYLKFAVPKVAFGQVFIGYELVSESHNEYEGYVRALNQTNGQPSWATPISNNATSGSSFIQSIILTLANRTLYVTTFNDLYSIYADTGQIQWMQRFTYWVLEPIFAYNRLFVAADLKLIAYGEANQAPLNPLELLLNPLITVAIIAIVATAVVAVYWFRKKRL